MSNTLSPSNDSTYFSKCISKSDLKDLPKFDAIKLINLIAEVSEGKKKPEDAARESTI